MKKFTLLSAAALATLAANAQYTCDPSTGVVAAEKPATVAYIVLADAAVAELQEAGAQCTYVGPDPDAGRNLWYWDQTFVPGDESIPRVDMEEGGYISVEVSDIGWSGAGLAVEGVNTKGFNDETRFHLAYMTPSNNGPASIAIILCDGLDSAPAKFALGENFDDNGAIYPSVGPKISDDWQGIDISLGDLKKLWNSFSLLNSESWSGNLFSWLGGGVQGQTMAFDTVYFYNLTDDAGVEGISADSKNFIVTSNTINLNGGNGMELYDLTGKLVKKTAGCVLGINNLNKGVYVVKSGKLVRKVVVR